MDSNGLYEEDAMSLMLDENVDGIEDRVEIMDAGYNIGIRCTKINVNLAEKPVKMAHFPPNQNRWYRKMWFLLNDKLRKLIEERFNDKGVLITGCKGYIGSNLTDFLKRCALRVEGITEDVTDKEALRPYFEKAEFVIHTAAKLKVESRGDYFQTNVTGTKNVAELCLEYGCKMIHFGTISNQEDYGKSKKEAQQVIEEYAKKGLKVIVLKLCEITDTPKPNCRTMDELKEDIFKILRFHDFNTYQVDEKRFSIPKS